MRNVATDLLLIVAALAALAAAVQNPASRPVPPPKPGELSAADVEFMKKAARTNLLEIALGRLAATHAQIEDVRTLGHKLESEHGKLHAELVGIALQKRVPLPEKLADDDAKMVDEMRKQPGTAFDRRYADHMVTGHTASVAAYKKAASGAQDSELRAFAVTHLPKNEEHLKAAIELQEKVRKVPVPPKPEGETPKPEEPPRPRKP